MKITLEISWRSGLRWFIGLVFIWAALGKIGNLQEFHAMLMAYRLPLPPFVGIVVAIVLPWLEMLCGLLLLANIKCKAALAWAFVLFTVFALCTGQAWLRGLDIACGCLDLTIFGIPHGSETAGILESVRFAFFRALALAGIVFILFWKEHKPIPTSSVARQ